MSDRRRVPSFPGSEDPSRYDAIVRRGRSLRRRRQVGMGAGTGGGVAAVALAVLMLTGGDPAPRTEVVADGDHDGTTQVTDWTTTTTEAPPTAPDELTVEIDATADEVTVVVTDPDAPISESTRQCITVTVEGDTGDTAETHSCDDIPAVGGAVTVDLPDTGGVLIGCAATLMAPDGTAAELDTELRSTTFRMSPPATLGAGDYRVTVDATSGVGDGCAHTGDEAGVDEPLSNGRTERAVSASATFTIG